MKKKKNKYYIYLLFILINFFVISLGVAFSSFQAGLDVSEFGAIVRATKDIRITETFPTSYNSDALSNWEEFSASRVSLGISLPNSDSTVTYNVKIENIGNVEASVSGITGLPNNLKYTLNNYTLSDMLCDDGDSTKCKLGSATTLSITIGYNDNGYDSSNTNYTINMDFVFTYLTDAVARISNVFYDSLQEAIDDVNTDNIETTIVLLKNTVEDITILEGQNIIFNLQNYTLSNTVNSVTTVKNYGKSKFTNGYVTNSNSATKSLIDNYSTGTLEITGGTFTSLGTKQAVYNEGGIVRISGNPSISSKASGTYDKVQRATVQNRLSGELYITGGTIINTVSSAVSLNTGIVEIGTKDDNPDTSSLLIQGKTYGVYNYTAFKFYDGTIKGITDTIYKKDLISDLEDGYNPLYSSDATYKIAQLSSGYRVRFLATGGTVNPTEKYVLQGAVVGSLPTPTRTDYIFDGWFTEENGGTQVNSSTIINAETDLYAHWHQELVARIVGGSGYYSLASAINAVPKNNTLTTVALLADVNENITVYSNQNIVFDFGNYTIGPFTNNPIITNKGKITITNGTLRQTKGYAAINNEDNGEVNMTGGTILSIGTRAGIYNDDNGVVNISGTAYISSNTSGSVTISDVSYSRGAVMNVDNTCTINITGGTIVGTESYAISNYGTLNLGIKDDGILDDTSPVIMGKTYGVKNAYEFNFYDGIIKGISNPIEGLITLQQSNTRLKYGTESIDSNTYNTVCLEEDI